MKFSREVTKEEYEKEKRRLENPDEIYVDAFKKITGEIIEIPGCGKFYVSGYNEEKKIVEFEKIDE